MPPTRFFSVAERLSLFPCARPSGLISERELDRCRSLKPSPRAVAWIGVTGTYQTFYVPRFRAASAHREQAARGAAARVAHDVVTDLILCVNIALGTAPLSSCLAIDTDGNGQVSVSELIQAVNAALNGCP